jgi:plastocyanin
MSEHIIPLRAAGRWCGQAALLALFVVTPLMAQPHAAVPLAVPQFSIDLQSPSTSPSVPASAVLTKPGPMVLYPGTNLGLLDPMDELQDFSCNRTGAATQGGAFLLLFSVDHLSTGGRPPDPALVATGRCFNVLDQASRHQSPADLFLTLDAFTTAGPVDLKSGGRTAAKNNTLAVNQGDTGGMDEDLSPAKAPVQQCSASEPADDVDGISYPSTGGSKGRNRTLYYTLSADSPSLIIRMPGIPGQQSGADIFTVADPGVPGTPELYAGAQSLGLMPTPFGDDIAALVVFDDGDGVLDPGMDEILFTLAPGSPALNQGQYSPADVFVSYGAGFSTRFASADDLGLLPTDQVDALEILPTTDPAAAVSDHAIFLVWPGDYDENDMLDHMDCAAYAECYSGPGVTYDTGGTAIHVVQVGPGPAFHPDTINVEVGDVVRWTWVDGPHNVVSGADGAPDGMFGSGPPGYPPRFFDVTFSAGLLDLYPRGEWIYPYFSVPDYGAGMVGSVVVHAHPCAAFDVDYDGDVDCADWQEFLMLYSQAGAVGPCVGLTIEEFVAALLEMSSLPGPQCVADMNGDGAVDGLDVQPFVDAILR